MGGRGGGGEPTLTDEQIHTHIVSTTLAFAPEAKGLRAHSLLYDSTLLPLYRKLGLEYIAVIICRWAAAYVRSRSIMISMRCLRTTAIISSLLQGQRDSTWLASGS